MVLRLCNLYLLGLAVVLSADPSVAFFSRFFRSVDSAVDATDSILVKSESIQDVILPQELEHHRNLQTLSNSPFAQLTCNSPMSACAPYSAVGAAYTANGLLTIPCGKCVTMDVTDNSTLTFSGGMRIIGKLVFPNEAVVTIRTTSVIVEGELSMTSTDPITGSPKVKFIMTGTTAVTFTPTAPNSAVCGSSGCNVGPRQSLLQEES